MADILISWMRSMTPRPLPWMKPGDLMLFNLDTLPWVAYLRLVEAYFKVRDQQLERVLERDKWVEYRVLDAHNGRCTAVLSCISERSPLQEADLARLHQRMQAEGVARGLVFAPRSFPSAAYLLASELNIELYSGNKLRVRIENMRDDQRRQVMDAIGAKG